MAQFKYARCETKPDLHAMEQTTGPAYAVYHTWSDIPTGWVAKGTNNEWWAWNQHGDMWVSMGRTRDDAADRMRRACWTEFKRDPRAKA